MPFPFHWQAFGKVIALRLKRSKNRERTQDDLTTADHEGDSSVPKDLSNPIPAPMHPSNSSPVQPISAGSKQGLEEFSTGFPSTVYPFGASTAGEASDIAQLVLPLVQAFTGVIPIVGAPIHATIGGLLAILQVIDRCDENKATLDDLTIRLYRLYQHLCNAPTTSDPLERCRRDVLASKLQDISASLRKLQKRKRRLLYLSVTQAITSCLTDIDRCLLEYLWSSQMQSQHETHELYIMFQRQREGPQNIGQSVVSDCVTLVDATGHHHPISVTFCTSYQQLNNMLRVLFERDGIEAQIQRRYTEQGKYDLCIDQGVQVTPLTNDEWSSIEPGTKIVMRIAIEQETLSGSDVDYRCHFCGIVNRLGVKSVKYWTQRQTACSTNCRECKRRFQVTRRSMRWSTRSSNSASNHTTEAEALLIRNFHVQQIKLKEEISEKKKSEWFWKSLELLNLEDSWEDKFEEKSELWDRDDFLRRVRETSVIYPREGGVTPSHGTYYGSSGIQEIE